MTIKEWIKKNRITQTRFAQEMGVTRHYFNAIACGRVIPSRHVAFLIEKLTSGKVKAHEILFPERFV